MEWCKFLLQPLTDKYLKDPVKNLVYNNLGFFGHQGIVADSGHIGTALHFGKKNFKIESKI